MRCGPCKGGPLRKPPCFTDALTDQQLEAIKDPEPPPASEGITFAMQERIMARCRPTLRAEDAKALTLLMSPAADEFAIGA